MGYLYSNVNSITFVLTAVLVSAKLFDSELVTAKVTSKAGTFVGLKKTVLLDGINHEVNQFLGIPYAEAPLKELRFSKPVAKKRMSSVYDATYHRAMCPQGEPEIIPLDMFTISENCLMLNIYVPVNTSINEVSHPVIIYIHGGGFTTGGSNLYSGDVLSAYSGVIVVTINYRLSIFGFLSTGDTSAPGNYGLWDQQLAIKWVHENIAAFNGDPSRVTLLGQSAGSESAIYQALYPGNKGLFKRVIAESGTPIDIATEYKDKSDEYINYAAAVLHTDCSLLEPKEVVSCLRNKTSREIMSNLATSLFQVSFSPVIDGDFIAADPKMMLTLGNSSYSAVRDLFSSIDFIIGGNNMDGASYLTFLWKNSLLVSDVEQFHVQKAAYVDRVLPKVFHHIYNMDPPDNAIAMIEARYTDITAPDDSIKLRDMLLELSTDYAFTVPILKTANIHAKLATEASTFVYEFTSRSSLTFGRYSTPKWVKGASHGEETGLVFGFSRAMLDALNVSKEYSATREEWELSKKVMTLWSNFAKTG